MSGYIEDMDDDALPTQREIDAVRAENIRLSARIEQLEAALAFMEETMHLLLDRQPVLQDKAREDALREAARAMPDLAVFADKWTAGQCSAALSTMQEAQKSILALINKEPKP